MKTIQVAFRVEYIDSSGLGPSEKHPTAFFHLSNHVRRDEADFCEVHLDEKAKAAQPGLVRGHVHGTRIGKLPSNISLCMAQFAWRPDASSGVNCRICLGTNYVSLAAVAETRPSKSHPWTKEMPFLMHTCENFCKGKIRLSITEIDTADLQISPLQQMMVGNAIETELRGYFDHIQRRSAEMGNAIKGTERMDAPYNYSETGLAAGPVPLVGYVLYEVPKTNLAMWEHAAEIVLRRDGFRAPDWNRLNDAGKARTMVEMCSLIGSYTDYTSDLLELPSGQTQGIENFGGNRTTGEDCEDSSNVNAQMFDALRAFAFPTETNRHAMLREVQRIAHQYVALQSLDVVRGAQVKDDVVSYGAHMKTNFIRQDLFRSGLDTTREGARVATELPWLPSIGDEYMQRFPSFLVGEGTGIADPDQGAVYQDNLAQAKGYVYGNAGSLAALKKPIGPNSPFFVGSLVGTTNHFIRQGVPYGTFWYTNGAQGLRGALADDLNHIRKDRFGFLPHPKLSRTILEATREAAALVVPPDSYTLTPTAERDTAATHPALERVSASVAALGRASGGAHVAVPVFARPYQLSDAVAERMIQDFRKLDRVYKVTHHLERISDAFYGYRIMVHVNVNQTRK